jgi:hypothetical protein
MATASPTTSLLSHVNMLTITPGREGAGEKLR